MGGIRPESTYPNPPKRLEDDAPNTAQMLQLKAELGLPDSATLGDMIDRIRELKRAKSADAVKKRQQGKPTL